MMAKKKDVNKKPKKMGRPKMFDAEKLEQLKHLMRLMPRLEDTAAFFKCGTSTIEDTLRNEYGLTFREFRDQNMVHTRLKLIKTALNQAHSGNNAALIFSLKNICGWRDKQPGEDDHKVTIDDISRKSDEELDDEIKKANQELDD